MKRELQMTADGSHTLAIPGQNLTYHSIYGAIRESEHVFINAGLRHLLSRFPLPGNPCIRIFEMGFGTGLNALLSYREAAGKGVCLHYTSVELYPLTGEEASALNYTEQLEESAPVFSLLHSSGWNRDVTLSAFFTLHKTNQSLLSISETGRFHLVYFDAFAPPAQPELWTEEVFRKMYGLLYDNGILVTYCAKGSVRRTMESVGFVIEKLPGPPGKREMIRAIKKPANPAFVSG